VTPKKELSRLLKNWRVNMYQDIVDNLVLPFGVDKVQGFLTEGNAFYIDLKTGEKFKAFELTEDLRRSEFESICKMIADKIFSA